MLPVGTTAPGFTLSCQLGSTYTLKEYFNQKNVVLTFLPAVAARVNREQLQLYQELLPQLANFQAVLLAICTDPICLGHAFIRSLSYPVLSDTQPIGKVGGYYSAFDPDHRRMYRTLIIVDKQGKVVRYHRAGEEEIIGADVIFATLVLLN
ncbi:MAG: redoxin domain-containing protein [Bacteroidota bacterium]